VRVWVEDFRFHVAMALRAVGLGIVVIAWAAVLGSEAQQGSDQRAYAEVGAAVLSLLVVHWLTALPPSATVTDLLRPLERDILAVARERARGDAALQAAYVAAVTELARERIRRGANVPRDRRAWVRALLRLAEANQACHELDVDHAGDG
jgi:hypothetical protein